jgi:hypothetical protein
MQGKNLFVFDPFTNFRDKWSKKQKVLERQQEHGLQKCPNLSLLKPCKFSQIFWFFGVATIKK